MTFRWVTTTHEMTLLDGVRAMISVTKSGRMVYVSEGYDIAEIQWPTDQLQWDTDELRAWAELFWRMR